MNVEILKKGAAALDINLSEEKIQSFCTYSDLLKEWNEKMNLTAITDDEGISIKHFLDSVAAEAAFEIKKGARIIDVGTGAGFPGLPLKIAREDLSVTLVDSLNKRINFLNEVIKRTGLENVETVHARAEDLGREKEYRERFDYAFSRAVAPLKILAEYDLPFVKTGGYFVALKSENCEEEVLEAKAMIGSLGGVLTEIKKVKIPFSDITRSIVVIKKEKKTPPSFPRTAKKIKEKSKKTEEK